MLVIIDDILVPVSSSNGVATSACALLGYLYRPLVWQSNGVTSKSGACKKKQRYLNSKITPSALIREEIFYLVQVCPCLDQK